VLALFADREHYRTVVLMIGSPAASLNIRLLVISFLLFSFVKCPAADLEYRSGIVLARQACQL